MSSQTAPENSISELQQRKQQLTDTELQLQQQAKDFGEICYLYNAAVCDKATLGLDLTSANKMIGKQRKRLEQQDAVIRDLQDKTDDRNCTITCSSSLVPSRTKAASTKTNQSCSTR
uniref:Uncharacterized protein n=1 Tax=Knipowitschia caucasica TaxID=637954 RepID=A0AAV2LZT5_KNICA